MELGSGRIVCKLPSGFVCAIVDPYAVGIWIAWCGVIPPRSPSMARQNTVTRPTEGRLSVVLNGERYEGTLTVDGPIVLVETVLLGSRRAQLHGTPEVLATRLLVELVYEARRGKRS